MSAYQVAKFCRDCLMDPSVRALAASNPEKALDAYRLTDRERRDLLAGEVGELARAGCNAFLLSYLPRWELFGLTVPVYSARMRAVAGDITPLPPAAPMESGADEVLDEPEAETLID